jgi:predicted phage terminase large subunit-like protein
MSMSSDALTNLPKPSDPCEQPETETEQFQQALFLASVCENCWLKQKPTSKQSEFLFLTCQEALYGGACGGGKSSALLMGALQFVDVPGYSAILFRRTHTDLSLPGALMDRANNWLAGTSARWNANDKRWTFPSGASLQFGYLDGPTDKYRYQSSEYQFVGFDELTQFREDDYRYLFSRLRRLKGSRVPLRMRSATNPGGVGHDWVKQRFLVEGQAAGRVFVPARLDDNPHLDRAEYLASLSELDPVTRAQLLSGDWSARQAGGYFRREWFHYADSVPAGCRMVRSWDLASTAPKPGADPDWSCGVLVGRAPDAAFYIADLRRTRATPQGVERLVVSTAELDGPAVPILLPQDPGQAGVHQVTHFARLLAGFNLRTERPTGDKTTRASPFSSQAEAGLVCLVRGPWLSALLDELEAFPCGSHDDQVDSIASGVNFLARTLPRTISGPLCISPSLPEPPEPTYSPSAEEILSEFEKPREQGPIQPDISEVLAAMEEASERRRHGTPTPPVPKPRSRWDELGLPSPPKPGQQEDWVRRALQEMDAEDPW